MFGENYNSKYNSKFYKNLKQNFKNLCEYEKWDRWGIKSKL